MFKALNDLIRRNTLDLLKERYLTAVEIIRAFKITKPSISYHFDILSQADLVNSQKQFVIYSLNTRALDAILTLMKALMR
ncbi:ArsR family transcriptional regulator [Pontibacter sp. H249]|uniref:ArsR family transcriptional regulator n=1 Tax=Pontibacter sp. H249 TaxID=3133420 RepID=UPI0030C44A93